MKNIFKFLFVFIVALFFLGYIDLSDIDKSEYEEKLKYYKNKNVIDVFYNNPIKNAEENFEKDKINGEDVYKYIGDIEELNIPLTIEIKGVVHKIHIIKNKNICEISLEYNDTKNDTKKVTLKPTDSKYQYIVENNPEIESMVKYINNENTGFLYLHDKYFYSQQIINQRLHNNDVNASINAINNNKDWIWSNILERGSEQVKKELKDAFNIDIWGILREDELENYANHYKNRLMFKKFGTSFLEEKMKNIFGTKNDKGEIYIKYPDDRRKAENIIKIVNKYSQFWAIGVAIATNYADQEDFNIDHFEQLMKTLDYICNGVMSFKEAKEKNAYFVKELEALESFWKGDNKGKVYGIHGLLTSKIYYDVIFLRVMKENAFVDFSLNSQITYSDSFRDTSIFNQLNKSLVQKRNMLYKKDMNTREIELQHKRDTIDLINDIFQKKNYYILDQNIIKMREILGYPSYSNYLFKKYF